MLATEGHDYQLVGLKSGKEIRPVISFQQSVCTPTNTCIGIKELFNMEKFVWRDSLSETYLHKLEWKIIMYRLT